MLYHFWYYHRISTMTKLAIFGDSYKTHLEDYTAGRMNVERSRFFGVSGMSTTRKFKFMFKELKKYRPDVVLMNLGGNNITWSTDIDNVVKSITNIVEELYRHGVRRIFAPASSNEVTSPDLLVLTKKGLTRFGEL